MRHHSIEETFRAISPKQRGVPATPAISVGLSTAGDAFSSSLSVAAQEISQLRGVYQAQADLLAANTQALEKTSGGSQAGSGGGVGSVVKDVVQKSLGMGVLGIIPLISGIASLFSGGKQEPAPLPVYEAPPSIAIDSTIRNGGAVGGTVSPAALKYSGSASLGSVLQNDWSRTGSDGLPPIGEQLMQLVGGGMASGRESARTGSSPDGPGVTQAGNREAYSPNVTVNVSAMDSQSFLDRSSDIADAVRQAVLNLHPLNSVLAEL